MLRSQATDSGIIRFELECISSDKEFEGKPKINYVTVFERPGLKEFLKQLSEYADLIFFTAGLEGYAGPLVDKIDSANLFSCRLYRPSTISTEYREHVKDLSCLSKDFCRIVIVDNNPFSFLLQPLNGIPCIPFSPGQPHDEQCLSRSPKVFIYFPLATNSSAGSAPVNASQIDEMVEQRVQESREQMQLQIEKVHADSDRKIAMVREEAEKREQQMQADSDRKIAMMREEAAKREQQLEERMMCVFNEKIGQMTNV